MSSAAPMPKRAAVPAVHDGTGTAARPTTIDVTYVDEARTHHVHARVVEPPGGQAQFLVMESPHDGFENDDLVYSTIAIRDAWEARFHQADLEGRLAQMGAYWRYDRVARNGWVALRRHPGVPRVDLRPVPWEENEGRVGFHHFIRQGQQDKLLVAVPRARPLGERYMLADLAFDFPRAQAGELRILHERLPFAPLQSMLVREHVDLSRKGFQKMIDPREFALKYGPSWRGMMRDAFEAVLERIRTRDVGPGERRDVGHDEDESSADFGRLLVDPRLTAVHRRFLSAAEEEALLASNPVAVRRWVGTKRRTTRHEEQHLLSLVEASLLARLGLQHGSHVDVDVARQLRRLAFYL